MVQLQHRSLDLLRKLRNTPTPSRLRLTTLVRATTYVVRPERNEWCSKSVQVEGHIED